MAEQTPAKKRPARQQMLESLVETEKESAERREATAGPEQKVAARAAQQAVAVADELSDHGVVRSIGELKSSVGKMLGDLSDRLEEQVSRYTQVQRAIAAKDQELREIYEIQRRELSALRQAAASHPKELEAAVAKTVKETTTRLQQESTAREQLLRQEFDGQENVQSTRIAALEQQVKEQSDRMAALLAQSEKAHTQVQEIAVRAIEGSGSTKQLAQLQQLLAEQARKPAASER